MAAKKATGRPSKFSQAVADEICGRLATGESLRGICRDNDGLPEAATIFRWLASADLAFAGFREQYARAREIQADALVDEILEIADDGTNDYTTRKGSDDDDVQVVNHDHIQRSRLRVDTRKWFASKVLPKKYGERVQTEVTGPDGGPIETKSSIDVSGLTEAQLRALASIPVRSG